MKCKRNGKFHRHLELFRCIGTSKVGLGLISTEISGRGQGRTAFTINNAYPIFDSYPIFDYVLLLYEYIHSRIVDNTGMKLKYLLNHQPAFSSSAQLPS